MVLQGAVSLTQTHVSAREPRPYTGGRGAAPRHTAAAERSLLKCEDGVTCENFLIEEPEVPTEKKLLLTAANICLLYVLAIRASSRS